MLDAVKDSHSFQEVYFKYSRLTTFLILPICLVFLIFGGDFISIWMGRNSGLYLGMFFQFLRYLISFPGTKGGCVPYFDGNIEFTLPHFFHGGHGRINLL